MNISGKKNLIVLLLFISNFIFSQSNEIKIKFIGNAGLYMTDGTLNVCVDFPYKPGAFGYMKYDTSELDSIKGKSILLFTHRHPDHYSRKLVKKLVRKQPGPWKISKKRRFKPQKLNDTINDFSVIAFNTRHRFSFHHRSYLITWHNKKIFISGDTESADTLAKVKNIDWAFIPGWIWTDAKEKNRTLDAKNFAIYHLYPNENVETKNDKLLILKKQNQIIRVTY